MRQLGGPALRSFLGAAAEDTGGAEPRDRASDNRTQVETSCWLWKIPWGKLLQNPVGESPQEAQIYDSVECCSVGLFGSFCHFYDFQDKLGLAASTYMISQSTRVDPDTALCQTLF